MPTYKQNNRFADKGTLPKRTLEYLHHGAGKGTRNAELFSAAVQFRDAGYTISEAMPRLLDRALKDQLTEPEARKAIESAYSRGARDPLGSGAAVPDANLHQNNANSAPFHVVGSSIPLPPPIPDGFTKFLTAVFEPDEYVAIAEAEDDGAGNWIPRAGRVLKREKWLDYFASGRLEKIFPDRRGVFIRINPMKPGGKSDDDVAAYRHCLVEFDLDDSGYRIPLGKQFEAFLQSGLPITAISFSGDKSLHALVRLDSGDRAEFDARRSAVWQLFQAHEIDEQNKNPSRYSRAPGFERILYDESGKPAGTGNQELLALRIGPKDWSSFATRARIRLPQIINGARLRTEILPLPSDIISGLIAHGEKGELCGGTKSYKTWTLIDQALAVATGSDWWGMKTEGSDVVYLNLEIPRAFFEARLREISGIRSIPIPDNFSVWHLRGSNLSNPDRWQEFIDQLSDYCAGLVHPYLVTDPVYKLLAGRNENAAGDVERLLWQIEEMLQSCGGTNFFGHHFAKGDSTAKVAIDRMAGSGVFARDPDSIFVMTPHEKAGCFVVESILRNHEPLESFVVEWKQPIFVRDDSLDPVNLKHRTGTAKRGAKPKFGPPILVQWLGNDCLPTGQLRKRVMEQTGMSRSLFYELLKEAEAENLIIWDGATQTWEIIGNSRKTH